MTFTKRSKTSRQRGSWTHGWGAKKKHRGFGSRGGKGNAGSGKRADQNKPSVWKDTSYFGKRGFTSKTGDDRPAINISTLSVQIDSFVENGFATKTGASYEVNLTAAGYRKLIGKGAVTHALIITVEKASPLAIERVTAIGGKVIVPET